MKTFAIIGLGLLSWPWAASALAPCQAQADVGTQCALAIDQVRPTQFAVGGLQVEDEVRKLAKVDDIAAYQLRKKIPVVIGPDGGFYLTDRHHLSSALLRRGEPQLLVSVIGRLQDTSSFWPMMQQRGWVYLYDNQGRAITPQQLPRQLAALADDPYRALAGYAQDRGYYRKTDAYFMEFAWARFLGEQLHWRPIDRSNVKAALRQASELSCHPDAQKLPGYRADKCR